MVSFLPVADSTASAICGLKSLGHRDDDDRRNDDQQQATQQVANNPQQLTHKHNL